MKNYLKKIIPFILLLGCLVSIFTHSATAVALVRNNIQVIELQSNRRTLPSGRQVEFGPNQSVTLQSPTGTVLSAGSLSGFQTRMEKLDRLLGESIQSMFTDLLAIMEAMNADIANIYSLLNNLATDLSGASDQGGGSDSPIVGFDFLYSEPDGSGTPEGLVYVFGVHFHDDTHATYFNNVRTGEGSYHQETPDGPGDDGGPSDEPSDPEGGPAGDGDDRERQGTSGPQGGPSQQETSGIWDGPGGQGPIGSTLFDQLTNLMQNLKLNLTRTKK